MNPAVFIGQKGVTQALIEEVDTALEATELIKVKFNDFKEKDQKNALIQAVAKATKSHVAGMIGHVAILYRQNQVVEKQKINLI